MKLAGITEKIHGLKSATTRKLSRMTASLSNKDPVALSESSHVHLLLLPNEVFHQICLEILGGEASLQLPIVLGQLKLGKLRGDNKIAQNSRSYRPNNVVKEVCKVFFTCRKLSKELFAVLYSQQVFGIHIRPPGTLWQNEHRAIQDSFLKFQGNKIQNLQLVFEIGCMSNASNRGCHGTSMLGNGLPPTQLPISGHL